MGAPIRLKSLRDFRGGLNLRKDAFNLGEDESPDMLNVDVDFRGGFHQRAGVTPFGGSVGLLGETHRRAESLWEYATTGGVSQIMASTSNNVLYSTGGVWAYAFNRDGVCRATTFKDRCYVQNGVEPAVRWNGSTDVVLGEAFNDNLEAPTTVGATGNMPIAPLITTHMGSVWVAGTVEGGIPYPNRVRFSHPNFPEDWRAEDFIDIDVGVDGDVITALVPFQDRLLIFKKRSVYALYGYSPETFQVFPVSREVGAVSQEAVVSTDVGVYFFSWPEGVFLYDGSDAKWVFERIYPALQDGRIQALHQDEIQLGWGNRRLWVAVNYDGSESRNRCFVLNPALGKQGSWTFYDLAVGPFLEYNPPGQNAEFLAADVNRRRVLRLDQEDFYFDDFGSDIPDAPIKTRFRTSWVDMGEPSLRKRFKRPDFVLRAGTGAQVLVNVSRDYDPSQMSRRFFINSDDPDASPGDGWGNLWGAFNWSRIQQATASDRRNEIDRGSPLGIARAVALDFFGPDTLQTWGVESITFKWQPRKVK